ncbi:hypothetical protein N431DRAFT_474322 [Stipitochalara longipes BDJ]|nr:hypothetical protein N431DRAFT_474322 [Stipitochalara longipes BDJ]
MRRSLSKVVVLFFFDTIAPSWDRRTLRWILYPLSQTRSNPSSLQETLLLPVHQALGRRFIQQLLQLPINSPLRAAIRVLLQSLVVRFPWSISSPGPNASPASIPTPDPPLNTPSNSRPALSPASYHSPSIASSQSSSSTPSQPSTPAPNPGQNVHSATSTADQRRDAARYWKAFIKIIHKRQKAIMGAIALFIAIIALGPGYATMAPTIDGLKIAKWAAQKDFRESCFADLNRNLTSFECENAMHGILPPPPIKRRLEDSTLQQSNAHWSIFVSTIVACIITFVPSVFMGGIHYHWHRQFDRLRRCLYNLNELSL